ncbi:MAG: flagellar biosynthesis anti-sigma factor FlgM [Clostridiales bacterium]|nr:flagellar biosynthesis anti-sigma factor FlgM [Clostridiales bacterium]
MRIDSYGMINQAYGVTKTVKTSQAKAAGAAAADQLSISQAGRDYQVAKTAVAQTSDTRDGKVAQLKSMIDAGTYSVDEGDFASKLLEKYNALI